MPKVLVVPAEKGKYNVLVGYIQRGISYTSEAVANKEADKLRKEIADWYK